MIKRQNKQPTLYFKRDYAKFSEYTAEGFLLYKLEGNNAKYFENGVWHNCASHREEWLKQFSIEGAERASEAEAVLLL